MLTILAKCLGKKDRRGRSMFMTNASMRRYLMFQKSKFPDIPERMWDRYRIYVECVGFTEHPKTLSEWIGE